MNVLMYRQFFEVQKVHWWFLVRKTIVLDAISRIPDLPKELSILDVGSGSGVMLKSLEELGETSGLDMSEEAIKFSKEIFSGEVRKGNLPDQVPFEQDAFHLITALDVIEHIEDDEGSIVAIKGLLKANGCAIVTVPAYRFLWTKFDVINEHKRRYTLTELREKLVAAGFIVENISYFNTLLFPMVVIVRMLNKAWNRDGTSDIDMPPAWINRILTFVFSLERPLLKMTRLPFGVSIIATVRKAS